MQSYKQIGVFCNDIENPITGGQIFDSYLIKKIQKNQNLQINLLTNQYIGTSNGFLYSFYCLKRIKEIAKNEILVINSSFFPHVLLFFLIFKLLYPSKKIYTIHHHFIFQCLTGLKRLVYKQMEFIFLQICNCIIVPSPYVKDEIRKRFRRKKIYYLELAFSENLEVSDCKKGNLLYVGTIEKRKGLKYLIEAITKMTNEQKKGIHLDIVGKEVSASYKKLLVQKIEKNKLESIIKFQGRVTKEELNQYYKNAMVFVFPSLHEGYGMVLVEAMHRGLPIIAFNNSAIPYTVKDKNNGLLVKDRNSEDLKNKILELLENEILFETLKKGTLAEVGKKRLMSDLDKEIENFIREELQN